MEITKNGDQVGCVNFGHLSGCPVVVLLNMTGTPFGVSGYLPRHAADFGAFRC